MDQSCGATLPCFLDPTLMNAPRSLFSLALTRWTRSSTLSFMLLFLHSTHTDYQVSQLYLYDSLILNFGVLAFAISQHSHPMPCCFVLDNVPYLDEADWGKRYDHFSFVNVLTRLCWSFRHRYLCYSLFAHTAFNETRWSDPAITVCLFQCPNQIVLTVL